MKKHSLLKTLLLSAIIVPNLSLADEFSLWARADSSNFLPKLVEAFNTQSEHKVNLQIVPAAELVQKYGIAAAGGSAPDALSLDLIYTPAFASMGQLKDITEFAKSLPYYDQLSSAHLFVGTTDGKIYGIPFAAESSVLVWNKKLFEEAGLDPSAPLENWDQIYEAAKKVGALGDNVYGFYFSGNCPGCNIFTFTPLIWASGGDIFNKDGTKVTLDTPQLRDAISFYRKMVDEGLVPEGSRTDSGANFFSTFAGGNVGIAPSGAFSIAALNEQHPDLDYGVTFIPGKDGGWSSFAGGENFVVSKSTKNMEPIEAFIRFAYSLDGQKILAQNGSLPVRKDLAKEALEGLDARYLIAQEAMENGKTPYTPVFNDIINSLTSPWIKMINTSVYGPEDGIDKAIIDAQKEMQQTIDDY